LNLFDQGLLNVHQTRAIEASPLRRQQYVRGTACFRRKLKQMISTKCMLFFWKSMQTTWDRPTSG